MRIKQKKPHRREEGFTLVELMVVIVIIGLLAAIVTFNVLPAGDKGKITKAKADISTIEGALEMYRLQMNGYPTTSQGLQALVKKPANEERWQGPYLKKDIPLDPWAHPYLYKIPGEHGEIDVYSLGADGQAGGTGENADVTN